MIILTETHIGVVDEIVGDQCSVTYETSEGPLKQIYHKSQFENNILPEEGQSVRADITITAIESPERDFDSDLPSFKDLYITGSHEL